MAKTAPSWCAPAGAAVRCLWAAAALLLLALAAPPAVAACDPAIARVVSLQGRIELRRAASAAWTAADAQALLCPGDALRVGARSRAALRLVNQSVLRVDQNSVLAFPPAAGGAARIEMQRGGLNVLTRTPKPFTVRTPLLNAMVEGTEFLVRADPEAAQVAVFEGVVTASNDAGAVRIGSGERAVAEGGAAPRRETVVRPADAVQWALHYPAIFVPGGRGPALLREADALARAGRIAEAFARLDAVPPDSRDARYHGVRAELLLQVGRVDEAREEIARARALDAGFAEVRALEAVIAVVRNEVADGLRLAGEAVQLDPLSPAAHLALSVAEQARFEIAAARAGSERAAALDPENPLAWARTAELRMAEGDLAGALDAARRAAALPVPVSRTQTVLGFARLLRLDPAGAREAFGEAIALDPADPLPRLGLGLARIDEGELQAGRESIEEAVALDPLNAPVRSYLGKAYQQERRSALAGGQYALAQALDPNDPTPWFYDAIRQQAEGRPVPALRDLETSIALNDRRAVYRSRLLLDEDRAARGVSVARIYRDLGFSELAVVEAANSLAIDPAEASAHRLLSEAAADLPRQEVARGSALLQSQLLQPLGLAIAQPAAPYVSIGPSPDRRFLAPGYNEYSLLYERRRAAASVSVLAGNRGLRGDEVTASVLRDRMSLSVGQFHYATDGFRPNAGIAHDVVNALLQVAAAPELMLQAELRDRRSRYGDPELRFDPLDYSLASRVVVEQETARLGLTWRPSPRLRVIGSFMDNQLDERQHQSDGVLDIDITADLPGRQSELQLQMLSEAVDLVFGAGVSRARYDAVFRFVDLPSDPFIPCFVEAPCEMPTGNDIRQENVYLYAHFTPRRDLTVTLGLANDHYTDLALNLRRWSPKLGVRWQAAEWLGLRAAAFHTVKRALIVDQTIEPVQIAGFNQFYDDFNGTLARTLAAAADIRIGPGAKGLLEMQRRRLRLGPSLVGADLSAGPFEEWHERTVAAGVYWTPDDATAATLQFRRETFDRVPLTDDLRPVSVATDSVPLTLTRTLGAGWSLRLGVTHVRQRLERQAAAGGAAVPSRFTLADASVAWRIPRSDASIRVSILNLTDEHFSYQDDNFRSSQPHAPRYTPGRSLAVSASVSF